jgi:hypothetical protein
MLRHTSPPNPLAHVLGQQPHRERGLRYRTIGCELNQRVYRARLAAPQCGKPRAYRERFLLRICGAEPRK